MISWRNLLVLVLLIQQALFALVEIKSFFPAGAQQGSQVDLVMDGSNLGLARKILFYKEGISLEKMTLEKKKLLLSFKVSADAERGAHPFRIIGDDGLSNLRYFHVAAFPEVNKTANIFSFEKAQKITVPCTVNAKLNGRQFDYYQMDLKKGQAFCASLTCMDLALSFVDCQLELLDKDKKRLAFSDDSLLLKQDPLINHTAPYTGTYYLRVNDFRFSGGNYRLHVADSLNALQIFPAGGLAKQKLEIFYDDQTSHNRELIISGREGINQIFIDTQSVHALPYHYSAHKNFFDQEKGHERKDATACESIPLAFNGRLDQAKDMDWFSFISPKDGSIEIQVLARELRSPIDALLELYDSKGKMIKRQDDSGSLDPKILTKVKKDTTYFVKIRDFTKASSLRSVYRILIDYQKPQLSLSITPSKQRTHQGQLLNISPASHQLITFNLKRESADSPIDYQFNNLPKGLTYKVLNHPEKSDKIPILFTLEKGTKLGAHRISAKLSNEESKLGNYSENLIMLMGPNNKEYRYYKSEQLALSTTIPAPFRIELVKNPAPMPRFGSHTTKIRVHRNEGFKKEIVIKAKSVLPGLSMKDQIKIPADKNEMDYSIQASSSTPLGKWPFIFNASTSIDGKVFTLSSDPHEIEITEHYFDLKMLQYTLNRGQEREITVDIKTLKTPQFPIKASLLGLPGGISSTPIELNKLDEKITFKIAATDSASFGYHRNSYVRFEFQDKGYKLNQNIRCNGTIYVPKPKKKKP
ncbi:hypothetical protein PQO03_06180 [Lentisphaera profundi]|uniref:Peptidase C-terminal archaeal/bacterial domain-containing protein n=1 Tax=Lentisphaera profundi TaxID=1658616 RepID=A0ABY7VR26_9BACT|nr:hypothetical protein [Lentisphaera profundi]WDE95306.1 hypothetical protein PQO03_06180 [Lentisphaera profundi]